MNRRPSSTRRSDFHMQRYPLASGEASDLFASPRRMHPLQKAGLMILLILVLALAVNFTVNHFVFLREVSVPLSSLKEEWDGYTILSLSDLKGLTFGENQSRLADTLKGQHFDAVVISGDMVSPMGNAEPFYELLDALRRLNPDAPVYFIAGDTDPEPVSMEYEPSGSPYAQWVLGARQQGAVLLSSPVRLAKGEQSLWLGAAADLTIDTGAQQSRFFRLQQDANASGDEVTADYAAYQLSRISGLEDARKEMKTEDVCICVTHTPPDEQYLRALRTPSGKSVDLLLCGHWMGGLTRFPLLGALFIPTQALPNYGLFAGNAYYGLHREGTTWVYHNPGLAAYESHYPLFFRRLFNTPAAVLIHLKVSSL